MTEPAAPSPSPSSQSRSKWIVVGVLVAIVGVGAWMGQTAGRLAHRAPRASGTRVAVLPLDATAVPDAPGLDLVLSAALDDALTNVFAASGTSTHHVVPLPVVRSKLALMVRGRQEGGLVEAAGFLDVDRVITGTVTPDGDGLKVHLEVKKPRGSAATSVDVNLPGENPLVELLDGTGPLLADLGVTAPAPPRLNVSKVTAYGLDVQGRTLMDEGKLREALPLFREAGERDETFGDAQAHRAITLALLRDRAPDEDAELPGAVRAAFERRPILSPVEQLLVDGLEAWSRWEVATPDTKTAVSEEVFKAFRAVTVQFPEERLGHLFLGRAYVVLLNGPTEALRHFESARRLSPDWFPTVAHLVDAWLKMGDRKHAAAEVRGYLVVKKEDPVASELLKALGDN